MISGFTKEYAERAARLRVPLGFVMLALYAWFSKPRVDLFAAGAIIAFAGIALRAWACGHLDKNTTLAISGPFAYVRNPLYLGTAVTAAGFAIAGGVWWLGVLFPIFLVLVYLPVVGEEESHLRNLFAEYAAYADRVPRFVPAPSPRMPGGRRFQWSLYVRNQEYNALAGFVFGLALLAWKLYW